MSRDCTEISEVQDGWTYSRRLDSQPTLHKLHNQNAVVVVNVLRVM